MGAADGRLDRIFIRNLRLRCIVGINPEEREVRQDVIVNVTMHADLRPAGASDRIEDTVNYKTVKDCIVETVEGSQDLLIERLAERIAAICLSDPRVQRAEVTLDKPGALRYADSVAVEIVRGRTDVAGGI